MGDPGLGENFCLASATPGPALKIGTMKVGWAGRATSNDAGGVGNVPGNHLPIPCRLVGQKDGDLV